MSARATSQSRHRMWRPARWKPTTRSHGRLLTSPAWFGVRSHLSAAAAPRLPRDSGNANVGAAFPGFPQARECREGAQGSRRRGTAGQARLDPGAVGDSERDGFSSLTGQRPPTRGEAISARLRNLMTVTCLEAHRHFGDRAGLQRNRIFGTQTPMRPLPKPVRLGNRARATRKWERRRVHLHVVPRWNGDTNFMPASRKVLPEHLRRPANACAPPGETG
jgi:hypothetical protein